MISKIYNDGGTIALREQEKPFVRVLDTEGKITDVEAVNINALSFHAARGGTGRRDRLFRIRAHRVDDAARRARPASR